MKKAFAVFACLACLAGAAVAQDQVQITSFEESFDWTWTAGSIQSFVDPVGAADAADGENVLVVIYDNGGAEWQHGTMNFPIGPIDLTGMREVRLSVKVVGGSTGNIGIRMDFPDGNILGFAYPEDENGDVIYDEWVELSWPIDRLSSQNNISDVSFVQGFIVPTPGDANGEIWLDNFYAVRPEGTPVIEEVLLYDFEETDPDTGFVQGWEPREGILADLSTEDVEAVSGNGVMVAAAGGGYLQNVQTINALDAYDNWPAVREIIYETRLVDTVPGGWIQSRLHIHSRVEGDDESAVETQTKELGFTGTAGEGGWKTMLFEIDLSAHMDNITNPDGVLNIAISTNNSGDAMDHPFYIDNFRVGVPEGGTSVPDWSVY